MAKRKMDAIQVEDALVGEQTTLAPRFKLFGQGLVEAAHGASAGCNAHQSFSDFADFLGACPTDKHLRQGLRYLGFIAAIALKHLRMELPLTISRHGESLNAPRTCHQVSCVI